MATKAELQMELDKLRAEAEELKAQISRQEQRDYFKKETDTLHDFYQSLIDSGFEKSQAWKITIEMVKGGNAANAANNRRPFK